MTRKGGAKGQPPAVNHPWRRSVSRGVGRAVRLGLGGIPAASVPFRPLCIFRPKPGAQTININPQKEAFSRKLAKGHF